MCPKARPVDNHRLRIQQDFYFVNLGVPRERRSELVSPGEVVSQGFSFFRRASPMRRWSLLSLLADRCSGWLGISSLISWREEEERQGGGGGGGAGEKRKSGRWRSRGEEEERDVRRWGRRGSEGGRGKGRGGGGGKRR